MNYATLFPALPGTARCWVYVSEHALPEAAQQRIRARLATFLSGWASHGRPVEGAAAILEDRFLLLAATLPGGDVSGCGIDASVHAVEAAGHDAGVAWLSPLLVFYRDADGQVQAQRRPAFRALVEAGAVTAETPVFDLSITTLDEVRRGAFERPAGASWHARLFRIPQQLS